MSYVRAQTNDMIENTLITSQTHPQELLLSCSAWRNFRTLPQAELHE